MDFEKDYPPKEVELRYNMDGLDPIYFIEQLAEELIHYGISLEINNEYQEGCERVKITKLF